MWKDQDFIRLAFFIVNGPDDVSQQKASIAELLSDELEGKAYTIESSYDAALRKEIVYIEFTELQTNTVLSFDIDFDAYGNISPEISNLTIYKKIPVKLPESSEEIIELPIHGFVYDPTVTEVMVEDKTIKLERNGSFTSTYPIYSDKEEEEITISCTNAAYMSAELTFKVKLFESLNDLLNIGFKDMEDNSIFFQNDNELHTTKEILKISGDYYGLIGAVVGYELYDYNPDNSVELIKQGVFNKSLDEEVGYDLGSGYESGSFTNQEIELIPGKQRLIIYVENPGGFKTEYTVPVGVDQVYPDVYYNLLESDQGIEITNLYVAECNQEVDNTPIKQQVSIFAHETKEEPYVFERYYVIRGEIKSLYQIEELDVRVIGADKEDVNFENQIQEIVINVDNNNTFQVGISIRMPEECQAKDYYISFEPGAPYLQWMKTGFKVAVTKDFKYTHIIPDFSLMKDAENTENPWTDEEKKELKKPLRIKIEDARFIPQGTRIKFLVNYETETWGELNEINPGEGIYEVVSGLNKVDLIGIRFGNNRISWWLTYDNGTPISSSKYGNQDMHDFMFGLSGSPEYNDTDIIFNGELEKYYNNIDLDTSNDVPDFSLTKDETTKATVIFNNEIIYEDQENTSFEILNQGWDDYNIIEGRNDLTVLYEERTGKKESLDYFFLYDSKPPTVSIEKYVYNDTYDELIKLSVIVKEANLDVVELSYIFDINEGYSQISQVPEIIGLGDNVYRIKWEDLEKYEYYEYDIAPDPVHKLKITVKDHAGNTVDSEEFEGLEDVERPTKLQAKSIILPEYSFEIEEDIQNFNGYPYFLGEENYTDRNFPKHAKFYNSSIVINDNPDQDNALLLERPENIMLKPETGEYSVTNGLTIRAGESMSIAIPESVAGDTTIFSVAEGSEFNIEILEEIGSSGRSLFNCDDGYTDPDKISFGFWFRYEKESYYGPDYFDQTSTSKYRRILTLYEDDEEEPTYSIYLGYEEDNTDITGNVSLCLIKEDNTGPLTEYTELLENLPILHEGPDDWDLILLAVDKTNYQINMSVIYSDSTTDAVETIGIFSATSGNDLEEEIDQMLTEGYEYYFGNYPDLNGHFSLAEAFYLKDEFLNISSPLEEIEFAQGELTLPSGERLRRYYTFDSSSDDIGEEPHQLTPSGADYFIEQENVNFAEETSMELPKGSLKGSAKHINLLKKDAVGAVIFDDSERPVKINVSPFADEESFTVKPANENYPAKYYFGNTKGNHGLKNDRWFSVSGTVMELEQGAQARLVLRVDEKEQFISLKEGDFHFVYSNSSNDEPEKVIMYLETDGAVKIKNDIIFSEGNYLLPLAGADEFDQSYATTTYGFQSEGTIHFWFKPFNVNEDGFVNYNRVLFDSKYITIETYMADDSDMAVFRARIHDPEDPDPGGGYSRTLESAVPVHMGWQHIQLSYRNADDDSNDIAYLYIDGKMAANTEGQALPTFSTTDPVYIGTNIDRDSFAEGFFDEVVLEQFYKKSLFEEINRDPLTITYYEEDPRTLDVSVNGSINDADISWIKFVLESGDGRTGLTSEPQTFASGTEAHGFVIDNLEAGAYRFRVRAIINGWRYEKNYIFVKKDRPRFTLKDNTQLIIKEVATDVNFSFCFDESYLMETADMVYPGVAIEIEGSVKNEEEMLEEFTETLFLVEDFIDQEEEWIIGNGFLEWTDATKTGEALVVSFEDIQTSSDISYTVKSFYFELGEDIQNFDYENAEREGTIPVATMDVDREYDDYKLVVRVGTGKTSGDKGLINELEIGYQVTSLDDNFPYTDNDLKELDGEGKAELFYDDILPQYGNFSCVLSLRYQGKTYDQETIEINWQESTLEEMVIEKEKRLEITGFSLIYLDKKNNKARLYLEYDQAGIEQGILYDLTVTSAQTNQGLTGLSVTGQEMPYLINYTIIELAPLPEDITYIKVRLYENSESIVREKELVVNNSATAPEIMLTNSVESIIAYNNVLFTWKGLHDGVFKPDIQYSYNFDNQGWSAPNNEWQSLELYGLEEGYHNFRVKALYMGEESPEESVTFFVDINRPVFDGSEITVTKLYDENDIFYAISITGEEGAIDDASLSSLTLNDEVIDVEKDGSFVANGIPVTCDGINELVLAAYDRVNNFTDFSIFVENRITEIVFPDSRHIRFAPLTIIGKLDAGINQQLDIYVFDGASADTDDFSGWKKAKINEDRTFFIEDIFVNPGTSYREAHTPLLMAVVFESGRVFTRTIDVYANAIIMPIDMELSTHAVEGESAETVVEINCKANVENISSWSIDFDGDGIYDDVAIMDNPDFGREYNWEHSYSSIGLVKPRVRVITLDGNFFSVQDEIIIHEKIKEASHVLVDDPIAITSVRMVDGTNRIFVLVGTPNDSRIEVYEVGRNDTYISTRLFTVSLNGFSIDNPVRIKADNTDHIYIVGNRNGRGHIYTLEKNQYGQYLPLIDHEVVVFDNIRDIDSDGMTLYITFESNTEILTIPLAGGIPDKENMTTKSVDIENSFAMSGNVCIAKDISGILISDFYNQRILHLSDNFNVLDFFGGFGNGEKEFLKPSIIESFENRIFIYDEGRYDIQVFNPLLNTVANLKYDFSLSEEENYFEPGFLLDITGISVIAREEGSRLYYYALILSRSTNKLAMMRLPQWEELRARVRNNKIVFLKDREVYTAKPTGSDLRRIVSSDSIPRIEGELDYPALSPDGRQLVFTSRVELYDGNNESSGQGNSYAYDNLYVIYADGSGLRRIPTGAIENYEIERPVFNSNGNKIIFSAKPTGGRWQIFVYNMKSGGITRLFESAENARFPYYSPDDRYVVFTTDYDGDEEIEIFDTENPSVRVSVTSNNCRDSFPVWNGVYPDEITDKNLPIKSKIAFVSERGFHKGMHYVYISRPSVSDVRVVTINGGEVGDDPDSAAIEVTAAEGDYPCFTGDGRTLVFEHYDGIQQSIRQYSFEDQELKDKKLPHGAVRPAGMKNTIANFIADAVNGDEVKLSWTPYTDNEIFYTVQFKINNEDENFTQKKVFTQDGTTLRGLEMGAEYLFRVCIIENEEEAASTQRKLVKMPRVAARPTCTIDEENPYLVRLHAWKPESELSEDVIWNFSWIIDNQEIPVQTSQDYTYEFATSGTKTILLKASMNNNQYVSISDPVTVEIISDIIPVIEYTLADDSSYIELNASNSWGNKIDQGSIIWEISGPARPTSVTQGGENTIVMLDGFEHKINVNLTLKRIPVNGQIATDTLTKNLVIDLDFKEIKPVITYEVDKVNSRLFIFSGENSLGNIDWMRAIWNIYADGVEIRREQGVSSMAYQFPESSGEVSYSVALTAARRNHSETETTAIIVAVEAAPIEPVIDYEILDLIEDASVVGQKILFSCGNSRGSNIDFVNAVWSVPVASESYGEQSLQRGPTAIYNLRNIEDNELIEVALTLMKRGGTDAVTVTRIIEVKSGEVTQTKLVVNVSREESATGEVFVFDMLSSTGPNIDWERTDWLVDGQYTRKGPVVRLDVSESGEEQLIHYTCTLYKHGDTPLVKSGSVLKKAGKLRPLISYKNRGKNNLFELSVRDTPGINIDWERTMWYIYDGNENVIQKQGAVITHAYVLKDEAHGYPAMVEMFFKGSSLPFMDYKTIDVEGDELLPVITWEDGNENWDDARIASDPNIIHFSAQNSIGGNIDWMRAKWTFGDGTPAEYGPVVVHKYPVGSDNTTYTVSLTLFRTSVTNEVESKTTYKTIKIGKDQIKPIIKAKLYKGHYLVLSAEESEGKGLLLDRCVWMFPGKGDSESYSESRQDGVIRRGSDTISGNASFSFGQGTPTDGGWHWSASVGGGYSHTWDTTTYEDFINSSESFSNQNMHTGTVCRRYVEGTDENVIVTLYVYRINSDGNMEGVSITVRVDLNKANTSVNRDGVTYGR